MLNEGIIVNDTTALVKSEMVKQIRRLGDTTPDELERAVFKALSGHDREEVNWDLADNQAGYFTWLKSFDQLIEELMEHLEEPVYLGLPSAAAYHGAPPPGADGLPGRRPLGATQPRVQQAERHRRRRRSPPYSASAVRCSGVAMARAASRMVSIWWAAKPFRASTTASAHS